MLRTVTTTTTTMTTTTTTTIVTTTVAIVVVVVVVVVVVIHPPYSSITRHLSSSVHHSLLLLRNLELVLLTTMAIKQSLTTMAIKQSLTTMAVKQSLTTMAITQSPLNNAPGHNHTNALRTTNFWAATATNSLNEKGNKGAQGSSGIITDNNHFGGLWIITLVFSSNTSCLWSQAVPKSARARILHSRLCCPKDHGSHKQQPTTPVVNIGSRVVVAGRYYTEHTVRRTTPQRRMVQPTHVS